MSRGGLRAERSNSTCKERGARGWELLQRTLLMVLPLGWHRDWDTGLEASELDLNGAASPGYGPEQVTQLLAALFPRLSVGILIATL